MITLFTTHPGLTHAAVDSFLKLIVAILGKVKNVVQKSFGDVKRKLYRIFFQLVRAFLCAGMDVCCTTVNKQIQQSASNERNRVMVNEIDQQWQADLVDMTSLADYNSGYIYLLTCIDVLSKYAWAVPLENKTGLALVDAFKQILESGRKPHFLQTDKGTEFLNRNFQNLLKKENIRFFHNPKRNESQRCWKI